MRYLVLISFVCLCHYAKAQITNPFATLKYDSVVMYDFIPGGEEGQIVSKGRLDGKIKKRVMLDKATVNSLNNILGLKSSFNGIIAGCFDPHLGFVYYRSGKIVGHISVCLACNQLYSTPDIKRRMPGLSNALRHYFNKLLIRYKFSYILTAAQEKKE